MGPPKDHLLLHGHGSDSLWVWYCEVYFHAFVKRKYNSNLYKIKVTSINVYKRINTTVLIIYENIDWYYTNITKIDKWYTVEPQWSGLHFLQQTWIAHNTVSHYPENGRFISRRFSNLEGVNCYENRTCVRVLHVHSSSNYPFFAKHPTIRHKYLHANSTGWSTVTHNIKLLSDKREKEFDSFKIISLL